ncbi:MAG: valine--tRNA ligase [Isosphaeraceae bacterium]
MSLADLPKQYEPRDAQNRWYAFWLEKGYFHADPASGKEPYAIVIPPPNVTGALHLGHALNNTIQDILIRWRRMQGYDALWMPGTDHAGIATQAVVERRLLEEEKQTRHDLGRDALVERIWRWKEEYEARILSQLRLMGCSCDWERTRFTLDEICARAVRETFFRLFRAGKIYRGKRLVNWDTHLRTAVADDEIEYEDVKGSLWTIKYPVTGSSSEFLHVATTRPETMLGDTAVAVHPDDPRYSHLIGKTVTLPLLGREIPVIGDAILVDPKFGTGCVKVTPAHDPNDYQTGLRHALPMINLLNPDGSYNENAGPYAGLHGKKVCARVVEDLEAQGLLAKVEPHANRVGISDRSKTPIEPYLSDQWFVKMADEADGTPGFAQRAIDAVTQGRIKIHPERYAKSYTDWLAEKRDWCVSRQLWWGHRIPVWRLDHPSPDVASRLRAWKADSERDPGARDAAHFEILDDVAYACVHDPDREAKLVAELEAMGFVQDPDVLDTWFSSALWPHSTLGWPEETPELNRYYPTSVLSTARDIITLWVARMVIFGLFNRNDVPFKNVFIHPVIQDGKGQRMSKSKGNGIDPVDVIDLYGADALRFTLAISATETQDLRMPVGQAKLPDGRTVNTSERFEQGRTFPNKFWNAARFALLNLEDYVPEEKPEGDFAEGHADFWILHALARTAREVTAGLESYQFSEVARTLRDFTWNDFCDWYVEMVKSRLRSEDPATRKTAQGMLVLVLDGLCRLLHPIIPFVTEQVWQALNAVAKRRVDPNTGRLVEAAESVCVAPWPVYPSRFDDYQESGAVVGLWQEVTKTIRNLRAERNVPSAAKVEPILIAKGRAAEWLHMGAPFIKALAPAANLRITDAFDRPEDCAVAVLPEVEVVLPLAGLIDKEAEAARHRKTLADLEKQIAGHRGRLNDESFVTNAPAAVVDQARARVAELEAQRATVAALLGVG